MWSLKSEKLGIIYFISPCSEPHVVSRSNGEIVITGDTSISRIHANLKVNKNTLEVVDCGSKYGTFVNDGIRTLTSIKPQVAVPLKTKDNIMFGRLGSKWTVLNVPIKTVVSTFSENTKTELNKLLKQVGGCIATEFTEDCTHLTMPVLSITMKVLLSLAAGIPIVTPNYWKDFASCIKDKKKLIDYKNYLPPLNESFLRTSDLNLDINVKRKSIFTGKLFIFMLSKHMQRYEMVIKMSGGTCTHLGQKLSKSELIKPETIVIQYIPTGVTQTQHSQSLTDCEKVYGILKQNGKRAIPDCEIGLAIIYCSLGKYCNPNYKVISTENIEATTLNLQTSTMLALDTPMETESSKNTKQSTTSCEIPDSEITKTVAKSNSIVIDDSDDEILCNLNISDVESEATQKSVIPEVVTRANKSNKRKNEDVVEMVSNKKVNLEDDIESTSTEYQPLESFLTKKPIMHVATKPKNTTNTTAKRNFSSRVNDSDNENGENEDLFCFKNPTKKSKPTTEVVKDNPFIDGEFNFTRKTRKNISSASQSSLAASCQFATQETTQHQSDSIDGQHRGRSTIPSRCTSNDTNGVAIDLSDYIKPVDVHASTWLSSEFVKTLKIESNDTSVISKDEKPNESDLWIESMKNCFQIKNTAVVLNNSENVYYNQNLHDARGNATNRKNFKAFKKVINYKKPARILNCVPIIVD